MRHGAINETGTRLAARLMIMFGTFLRKKNNSFLERGENIIGIDFFNFTRICVGASAWIGC
jgi:hypothetical protein